MNKGEIIDFDVLRLQAELDTFNKTQRIPESILYSGEDMCSRINPIKHKLSAHYQELAEKYTSEYCNHIKRNIDIIQQELRHEYSETMNNLATNHSLFAFESVLQRYRHNINAVRALYYETRSITRNYQPDNDYHVWLRATVTDAEINTAIIDALEKDSSKLHDIVKKYYYPITKHTKSVPLELLHAKSTLAEYKHYTKLFCGVRHWKK